MNKKLMAVAVAGALSAPGLAVAQVGGSPGVTLYGVIDSSILRNKFSAVTTPNGTTNVSDLTKSDVFPSGNRVGVRGREDLGGGTALWFQLEAGAWADLSSVGRPLLTLSRVAVTNPPASLLRRAST